MQPVRQSQRGKTTQQWPEQHSVSRITSHTPNYDNCALLAWMVHKRGAFCVRPKKKNARNVKKTPEMRFQGSWRCSDESKHQNWKGPKAKIVWSGLRGTPQDKTTRSALWHGSMVQMLSPCVELGTWRRWGDHFHFQKKKSIQPSLPWGTRGDHTPKAQKKLAWYILRKAPKCPGEHGPSGAWENS